MLATTTRQRTRFTPTVPTMSELDYDVVFEDWLGQNISIRLATHGGERERFLNGIVSQMEQTGVIGRLAMLAASYELEATDPDAETYD